MAELHEDLTEKEEVETSSDRSFGLVFTAVFAIVGLWPLVTAPRTVRVWALCVSAVVLVLALAAPRVLAPLNRLWTKLGLLLGKVVNPLVMAALFFSTVTPIAILLRLFGKDPLNRRFDRSAESYWIERTPPGPPPDSMKNQF